MLRTTFGAQIMRIKLLRTKAIVMICLFFFMLSGCVINQHGDSSKKRLFLPETDKGFHAKIAEIEGGPATVPPGEKLLQLSLLYSHKSNPEPDYNKALNILNQYIAETPKHEQFEFADYIGSLLEEIIKQTRAVTSQKRALRKERREKVSLVEKNKDLQKKINSLKKLDIRLEKQRLGVE